MKHMVNPTSSEVQTIKNVLCATQHINHKRWIITQTIVPDINSLQTTYERTIWCSITHKVGQCVCDLYNSIRYIHFTMFTSGFSVQIYKCHFNRTCPHQVSPEFLFCHLFVYCDCLIQTNAAFLCAPSIDKNWREIAIKLLQDIFIVWSPRLSFYDSTINILSTRYIFSSNSGWEWSLNCVCLLDKNQKKNYSWKFWFDQHQQSKTNTQHALVLKVHFGHSGGLK